MKKLFLMSMAAVALLASCSNDETVEMAPNNNAIGFASFVDKSTKATDLTLANLGSIEVYGWRGSDCIFNKQKVEVNATSGVGTYTPLKYWEAGYTYTFEAFAPFDKQNVSILAKKDGSQITFTNDAVTDLLHAKAADVTTASPLSDQPSAVSFTFKHLLSRVKFTFKNTFPANAAAKITVTNVKITNAYKTGVITPAATDAAWTVSNNDLEVSFASTDVADLVAGTGAAATEHMYLIPATSPSYTVNFTVTLNQGGMSTNYNHTATITTDMEMGKSYNFVASLNENNVSPDPLKPIEFKATLSNWEDFANTDITSSTSGN